MRHTATDNDDYDHTQATTNKYGQQQAALSQYLDDEQGLVET